MRELIATVEPSVARVYVPADQGWMSNGTAFAISEDGLFATCSHVVAAFPKHSILFNGSQLSATVVDDNPRLDLALVQVKATTPALALSSVDEVEVGDEVLWGGFPFGSWLPSWHKGMVSYLGSLRPDGTRRGLQLDGTVNGGNSGGPIVNPVTGSVVGIVTSRLGALSDALATDLDKLHIVSGSTGPRAGMKIRVGDVSVDPMLVLAEAIEHMARSMQLGVGYGISAEYLEAMVLDRRQ